MSADTCIHVVDDDPALRGALVFLFESVGWNVRAHAGAGEFLVACDPESARCVVLDIRMPHMSGLELQQVMRARGMRVPIVFLTGHADVSLAVQAMKQGACDFIEKPFHDQTLLDAVSRAVRTCSEAREADEARNGACGRLAVLSPRERDVARLVAQGLPNKFIGRALGISERTVHVHRQHIMEKAGVSSAAQLARLMIQADPRSLD
jgi:FixJ family two-component response regulator